MNKRRRLVVYLLLGTACALARPCPAHAADAPLGGFIPLVGLGLTRQFNTFDNDPDGTFFIADPRYAWSGTPMGPGGTPYFDLALLDTGAATHILTQAAASASGFGIATPFSGEPDGFRGTNFQTIFGASGSLALRINDPLGVYAGGLAHGGSNGSTLTMNTGFMRGQSSFAMLEAPAEWKLPNILGLPIAAHHAISIRNDQPQIFQHQGRTVRTPNVEFIDLGTGSEEQITRRTDLRIRPSAGFLQGPFYVQNFDLFSGDFHENPLSPSVIENGAMFIEVDMADGNRSFQDKELLFDTGADLTVLSQLTAARLGINVLADEPDFMLEVEGAGGVSGGVPGFYIDELNIDTIGGSFTLQNVPVAVIDLPNPNDPANTLDGIIGMNLFTGRNLVIDANPAASASGGGPPRLYIGDPVTETHTWASTASGADWSTSSSWSPTGTPSIMWDAQVRNVTGTNQIASVNSSSTVYRLTVGGGQEGASISVLIGTGATLTTFGEVLIEDGGRLVLLSTGLQSGRLDAQFVNIDGGVLAGEGQIFVGTGPINGAVRNLSGRIEPSRSAPSLIPVGHLQITGDLVNLTDGTISLELAGTTPIAQYDSISASRFMFLAGTLEINLIDDGTGVFTPNTGDMFTILTAGEGIVGEFENLLLPAAFQWDVTYGANDVVLTVVGAGLGGDFNGDGTVDAADYVLWRKNGGTQQDYQTWRSNFGTSSTGGGSANHNSAGVPEPTGSILMAFAACGVALIRNRSTWPVRCAAWMSCGALSAS